MWQVSWATTAPTIQSLFVRPVKLTRCFAELQDLIDQLESVSVVAGERQEAIDHVLASISKLQNEVSDAAEFTPSYDRKQYSDVSRDVGIPSRLLPRLDMYMHIFITPAKLKHRPSKPFKTS